MYTLYSISVSKPQSETYSRIITKKSADFPAGDDDDTVAQTSHAFIFVEEMIVLVVKMEEENNEA